MPSHARTGAAIRHTHMLKLHQQDGQVCRFPCYLIFLLSVPFLRPGANPWRVINQIRTKLRIHAAAVQVSIGVEDQLEGVVDLVRWKAVYNKGTKG